LGDRKGIQTACKNQAVPKVHLWETFGAITQISRKKAREVDQFNNKNK